MVRATFYAVTIVSVVEERVLSGVIRHTLKDAVQDIKWRSFEIWLETHREALLHANHPLSLEGRSSI